MIRRFQALAALDNGGGRMGGFLSVSAVIEVEAMNELSAQVSLEAGNRAAVYGTKAVTEPASHSMSGIARLVDRTKEVGG